MLKHKWLGGVMQETQMVRWCNAGDVNITHYAT